VLQQAAQHRRQAVVQQHVVFQDERELGAAARKRRIASTCDR